MSYSRRTTNRLPLFAVGLVTLAVSLPTIVRSAQPSNAVIEALENARAIGAGRFTAHVEQTLIPRPLPSMIGQTDQRADILIEGEVTSPEHARLSILPTGGGLNVPPINLVREGADTYMLRDGERVPVQNPLGAIAPTSDFLGYLLAAENVRPIAGDARDGLAGYAFDINGPRLALEVRDWLQRQLQASGDLVPPPGVTLSPSPVLQSMSGKGELWVGDDGLPVRQVLAIELPEITDAYGAQAHITVKFSFDQREQLAAAVPFAHHLASVLRSAVMPSDLALLLVAVSLACLFFSVRNRRWTYRLVVLPVTLSLIATPLLHARSYHLFQARLASAAQVQTIAEALDSTSAMPGSAVEETRIPERVLISGSGPDSTLSPKCGDGEVSEDSDADGLNDAAEYCLGTDPYLADSDRDLVPDKVEIDGFAFGDTMVYGNPLRPDSNSDGLVDGEEWPVPWGTVPELADVADSTDPDGDGVPNLWDDDNDGDLVPDALDLSPFSYVANASTFTLSTQGGGYGGYQYIEVQLRPDTESHLRVGNIGLDWPMDDKGQIQDNASGDTDLQLRPMLKVRTDQVPPRDLARRYGASIFTEGGEKYLYAPLVEVRDGARVVAFAAKVAYPPDQLADIRWEEVKVVWLLQRAADPAAGVSSSTIVQTYDGGDFRVTGLSVTKSGSYSSAILGTPGTPNDDTDLFNVYLGLSATFMSNQRPDLEEIWYRFDGPYTPPMQTWGVASDDVVIDLPEDPYRHTDEGIARTNERLVAFLGRYSYPIESRPSLLLALQQDSGTFNLDEAGSVRAAAEVVVNLAEIPIMTMRGLKRVSFAYEGDPSWPWRALSFYENLQLVRERYADLSSSLEQLQEDYPNLTEALLRQVVYSFYAASSVSEMAIIAMEGEPLAPDEPLAALDEATFERLTSDAAKLPEYLLDATDLIRPGQAGYSERPYSFELGAQEAERSGGLREWLNADELWEAIDAMDSSPAAKRIAKVLVRDLKAALKVNKAVKAVSFGLRTGRWGAVKQVGKIVKQAKGVLKKLTKSLGAIGCAVSVGLIWVQFGLSTNWDSALAIEVGVKTAVIASIVTITLFVISLNPVGAVLMAVLAVAEFFVMVFADISIMEYMIKGIYRAEEVTRLDPDSIAFTDFGAGPADPERGLVAGNSYRISDQFRGDLQIVTDDGLASWWGKRKSYVRGEYDARAEGATASPWYRYPNCRVEDDKVACSNDLFAEYALTVGRNRHLEFKPKVTARTYMQECVFWGICWARGETTTYDEWDWQSLYLDVLPSELDELLANELLEGVILLDSDGDGLTDSEETPDNALTWDSDGDGLSDWYEIRLGSNPDKRDTDDDGLDDGIEDRIGTSIGKMNGEEPSSDSDGDHLNDVQEAYPDGGWQISLPGVEGEVQVFSDPLEKDADGDGLCDSVESDYGTSPYAYNDAPRLTLDAVPLAIGEVATVPTVYVEAGDGVEIVAALDSVGPVPVDTTLEICLPGMLVPQSGVLSGDRDEAPSVSTSCNGYAWSFSGDNSLMLWERATVTITADVVYEGSSTGSIEARLPYEIGDTTASGLLVTIPVVRDDNPPWITVLEPQHGELLGGGVNFFVIGGRAGDVSTWVESVEMVVTDGNGGEVGRPEVVGTSDWACSWELPPDGPYTLTARAYDHVGHSFEQSVQVTIDNTPPSLALDTGVGNIVSGDSTDVITVHLSGSASDDGGTGLSRVQVSTDGRPWREVWAEAGGQTHVQWSTDWRLPSEDSAQGKHTVSVRARDRAGNEGTLSETITVDVVAPTSELTDRTFLHAPPHFKAGDEVELDGVANDAGRVPPPPRPAELNGVLDSITDATIWLGLSEQGEDDEGVSVTWLGDFNGDRLSDLAVGLPAASSPEGRVIIVSGRAGGWPVPDQPELLRNSRTSFVGAAGARIGASLTAAGDVDGDGFSDLLVGDPSNNRAFLIFGQPGAMGRDLVLDGPDAPRWIVIRAPAGEEIGVSLAAAGDVNGDGYDDLLIGASGVQHRAYLLLGQSRQTSPPWDEELQVGDHAAAVISLDQSVSRLAGVGDMDDDGLDEFAAVVGNEVILYAGSSISYTASSRHPLTTDVGLGGAIAAFESATDSPPIAALGDVVGDADGDDLADFAYVDGGDVLLISGDKQCQWGVQSVGSFSSTPRFLAAPGDVDADEYNDVLVGTDDGNASLILASDLTRAAATLTGVLAAASVPYAAGGDINSDGSSDLLLVPGEMPVGAGAAKVDFGELPQIALDALPTSVSSAAAGSRGSEGSGAGHPAKMTGHSVASGPTSDTFYVDDGYCGSCANGGHTWGLDAFSRIQDAVDAADGAGDTVIIGPGVYAAFDVSGPAKHDLEVRGVNADAVYVDGDDGDYAASVADCTSVTIADMTLRNANSGVLLKNAGRLGYEVLDNRTVLEGLVIHNCANALSMDRPSTAVVRQSTLVVDGQGGGALVAVDGPPDEDVLPSWEALSPVPEPIGDGGALVRAGDVFYAVPGDGSTAVYAVVDPEQTWITFDRIVVHAESDPWGAEFRIKLNDEEVWLGGGLEAGDERAINVSRAVHPGAWHRIEVEEDDSWPNDDDWLGYTWVYSTPGSGSHRFSRGGDDVTVYWTVHKWHWEATQPAPVAIDDRIATAGDAGGSLWLADSFYWKSLDGGLNHWVWAIAVADNGDVYAGGRFTDHIARWDADEDQWYALGGGLNGNVRAIAVADSGDVYAGGEFTDHIARWDADEGGWHALGGGLNGNVRAIAVADSGDVYAGGSFQDAGGDLSADKIARWDGLSWHALGGGLNGAVEAIAVADNGDVYAGGSFQDAGGDLSADKIARWDGLSWHALDGGRNDWVLAIAVADNGDVYAGGWFTGYLARWDADEGGWHALGGGLPWVVWAIAVADNGDVYAGGAFWDAGGDLSADNIARWDADEDQWHALGGGLLSSVYAIAVADNGDVYAGGAFWDAGGNLSADRIARFHPQSMFAYDGATWRPKEPPVASWGTARIASDGSERLYLLTDSGSMFAYHIPGDDWEGQAPLPAISSEFALTWAGGLLYALRGAELYRYDPGSTTWTGLADVPAGKSIYSGGTMAADNATDPTSLYIMLGGNGPQMVRYNLESNSWDTSLENAPLLVRDGNGLASADGYLYLYATPDYANESDFFRYGKIRPPVTKLTVEDTAFVNLSDNGAEWVSFDPANALHDFQIDLDAVNAWVSDSEWSVAPQAEWGVQIGVADAAFVAPEQDLYRTGFGSILTAGYHQYRPDAIVGENGEFSTVVEAINSGANRVLVRPGLYQEPFQLVSGVQVIGAGADKTFLSSENGSPALVRAEGVVRSGLSGFTLKGSGSEVGVQVEDGAREVVLSRNIIHNTATAIQTSGRSTDTEVVNSTVVDNQWGLDAVNCAPVDVRNTLFVSNDQAALQYQECSDSIVHSYNLYWTNGSDISSGQPGPGELFLDPLFVEPREPSYRTKDWSPVIDAGNPSDPVPPGTGGRADIGYVEQGRAAFYADDDYCMFCVNDGLTWGMDAFDDVQDALDAAEAEMAVLSFPDQPPQYTVGVGPGTYAGSFDLHSHVSLVGSGAEVTTLEGRADDVAVLAFDGVVQAEVRGFTIKGTSSADGMSRTDVGVVVTGASNDVTITRNVIVGSEQGVAFRDRASGRAIFNTVVGNTGAAISSSDNGTWVVAENNIVFDNDVGLRIGDSSQILHDYNLLNNDTNFEPPDCGPGQNEEALLNQDPGFEIGSYRLLEDSPCVDAASPFAPVPPGGGARADLGYREVLATPLTIFLGKEGMSSAIGNSGVAEVSIGLVGPLTAEQASMPVTETLPGTGDWVPATVEGAEGETARYWNWSTGAEAAQKGVYRVYSRAADVAENEETEGLDWYEGSFVVDGTPPTVTWLSPADGSSVQSPLELRAQVADYAGGQFGVRDVWFEVNAKYYPGTWSVEPWDPATEQPRVFRAWIDDLTPGTVQISAVAVAKDRAGNEGRSASASLSVSGYVGEDSTPPNVAIDRPSPGELVPRTVVFEGTVSDPAGSGVASVELSLDGGYTWMPTDVDVTAGTWKLVWGAPGEQQYVSYPVRVRALDLAGNLATEELSITVDNEPPTWVSAPEVSVPAGTHFDAPTDLTFSWQPPVDGSDTAEVYISVAERVDEDCVVKGLSEEGFPWPPADDLVTGTEHTVELPSSGIWCVHATARDLAGNMVVYDYGPWFVGTIEDTTVPFADRVQSIHLDGHLDVIDAEWRADLELLDDDEREGERQELYATWDGSAVYLGWQGASWTLDGTLWAYLDVGGGGTADVVQGTFGAALPFMADYAVEISDPTSGTLWYYDGGWQAGELEFAHGDTLGTEVRIPLETDSASLKLIAFALNDEDVAWSVFPTTNPVGGPWQRYYSWDDLSSGVAPNAGQPRGVNVHMSLDSPQAPMAAWGPAAALEYVVGLTNRESRHVADLQFELVASTGLAFQDVVGASCADPGCTNSDHWLLDVPTLAPGASHSISVTGVLASELGELSVVNADVKLIHGGTTQAETSLSHRVDGQPPLIQIDVPPGNCLRPGSCDPSGLCRVKVSGSAEDGQGSGVAEVQVVGGDTSGTLLWAAEVEIPQNSTSVEIVVSATDAAGNTDTIIHVFEIDMVPPVLGFSVPETVGGYSAVLKGTASDPFPADSTVVRVEVQLDGEDTLWQPVNGPYDPGENGQQNWAFRWALPHEDGVQHQLRARAFDAAGNESYTEWQWTIVDSVRPATTVTHWISEGLLSDYLRDPYPIVEGEVTDGYGIAADGVQARIYTPDGATVMAPAEITGESFSITPVFQTALSGEYRIYVEAIDLAGNKTTVGPYVFTALNTPPEADAGGPYAGDEGAAVLMAGATATDVDDDPLTFAWSENSGKCEFSNPTALNPSITCSDDGTYVVTLSVSDDFNEPVDSEATVEVVNVAPTVDLAGSSPVDEGDTATYTFTVSDPGADSHAFAEGYPSCGEGGELVGSPTFGDGSFQCTFLDGPAESTVSIRVEDDEGAVSEAAWLDVMVNNVAPAATFDNDGPVDEGSSFTLSLTNPNDPSSADATVGFEYAFDCGDGSGYGEFGSSIRAICPTTDNGVRAVGGKIKDKDGGVTEYSASVTVNNVRPTALDDTASANEDGPAVTVDVLANDSDLAGAADPLTVSGVDTSGTSGAVSHTAGDVTYDPNGQFEWLAVGETAADSFGYTIDDGDGGTANATVNVTINGQNDVPTVAADKDKVTVDEGQTANNSGTFDDVDGSDNVTISASVGAISQDAGNSGRWSWSLDATDGPADSQVTITADDGNGSVAQVAFNLTVNNVAPIASFGNDGPVDEGSSFTLSLTNPNDPSSADADVGFEYAFDCGEGSGYGEFDSSSSAICPTTDDGVRAVGGKIRDKDGGVTDYSASVTVNNVAPVVMAASHQSANEGANTSFTLGSFSDVGMKDKPWHVDVDWGDASSHTTFDLAAPGSITAQSHTYDDNGSYVVTVKVTDKDGSFDSKNFYVTVANVAPAATLGDNGPVNEASPATITFSGQHDPSNADTMEGFYYAFSCINGDLSGVTYQVGSGTSASTTCTYDDGPSTHTVKGRIIDKDGGYTEYTTDVTVNNVAPDVEAGDDRSAFENSVVTLDPATYTDPGVPDTHTATINWGDGIYEGGAVDQDADTVSAEHVYTAPGIYTVEITVEDSDGEAGSDSFDITVFHGFFSACVSANKVGDDLQVEEDASAYCSIYGEGKVELKKRAVVSGDLVARTKEAKIEEAATVGGSVASDSKIELKKNAEVGGDVTSGDDVKLEDGSSVGGDVTAAGKVELKGTAIVGGTINEYASVPALPEVTQVTVEVSASGADVTVRKNETTALAPDTYGKLKVEEGGTLELDAGTYTFESIDAHKNASIEFGLEDGDVTIDVEKQVDLKEGVVMTVSGGDASDILFRIAGSSVKLGKDGTFVGTYVAPDAHIDALEDASVVGALHGRKVHLKKGASVRPAPAFSLFVELFVR